MGGRGREGGWEGKRERERERERERAGAYPGFTIGDFLAVAHEKVSDHAHFSAPPTN